jgi:sugar lactone lactonase YvrE
LLMASETGLFRFDINSGARSLVVALEADNALTRSNDGRADPWGGFWIGTMGKQAGAGQGAIYRYYQGEITRLYGDITISNAICFAPHKSCAYFTDTVTRRILRQPLSADHGWPVGAPELFVDLNGEGLNPDGAVVDSQGCLWNAQWGASRIARYAPDGSFLSAVDCPAEQVSCPAFGGDDLQTLFATSAAEGLKGTGADASPQGRTWQAEQSVAGQAEHQVRL